MRKLLFRNIFITPLTEAPPDVDEESIAALAASVDGVARRKLGHSLSIRHVDAGSCNGCELELHALNNAYYDLERYGIRFVASPRHADILLVTGPVSKNMRQALEKT
jgi:NADH:ubiquinone oxidoreductase subunit B-like Fe-S oxidoreductase